AFGAAVGTHANVADHHAVAVHGTANRARANENVALDIRHRLFRNHETVTVAMARQSARDLRPVLCGCGLARSRNRMAWTEGHRRIIIGGVFGMLKREGRSLLGYELPGQPGCRSKLTSTISNRYRSICRTRK